MHLCNAKGLPSWGRKAARELRPAAQGEDGCAQGRGWHSRRVPRPLAQNLPVSPVGEADGPVTCLFLVGRTALETHAENTTVSHITLSSCP